MWIYILLFLICALICLVGISTRFKNTYAAHLICLVVALFAGLRWEMWSDWESYYDYYMGTASANDFEFGYSLLVKLGKIITLGNYNLFLFLIYFGAGIIIVKVAEEIVEGFEPYVALFYLSTLIIPSGGQRMFIAECIYFISLKYLSNGDTVKELLSKNLKYFVIVIVATLFHRTAFIMLIIPFVLFIVKAVKTRYLLMMFLIVGILNAINFFDILFNFTVEHLSNIMPSVRYRMVFYINTLNESNSIFSFGVLKHFIIVFIMLAVMKTSSLYIGDKSYRDEVIKLYAILFVGILLSLVLGGQYERIKTYSFACEGFLGALIIKGLNSNNNRIIISTILVLLLFVGYVYNLYSFYPELLYPYKWCL